MRKAFSKESFQSLPERFIHRPAKGAALSLKIDGKVERSYQISPRGILAITTPESWEERKREEEKDGLPITVYAFKPGDGQEFMFLLTPHMTDKRDFDIKSFVEKFGQRNLHTSDENKIDLVEVRSPTAQGYVYTLTDKKLAGKKHQGEDYPYMTQGMIESGESWSTVTVLSDSKDDEFLKDMRNVMESMTYRSIGTSSRGTEVPRP